MRNAKNKGISNAQGQCIPYNSVILISTWLTMNEITQLASSSKKLLETITGIDLKNQEHQNALTELSNQLKTTSISRGFTWFQTITYSTLLEFIVTKQRKQAHNINDFVRNCAVKIARENNSFDFKSMTARNFVTESFQATVFFALITYAVNKLDLSLAYNLVAHIPILFYASIVADGRICMLPSLFKDFKSSSVCNKKLASLENTITPALHHLQNLINLPGN